MKASFLRLIEEKFGLQLTEHQARNLDPVSASLAAGAHLSGPQELFNEFADGQALALLEDLAAQLTIGETHFFRVEPQIEALRGSVLPELINSRSGEKRLRIWSAGCSTGEEAYTLAILVRELLPACDSWDIRILATDINNTALESARAAVYGEWSFRGMPGRIRERYFSREGKGWQLNASIRGMVQFAPTNLAASALPLLVSTLGEFDLISCRNVTIYFSEVATQRLYGRFAEAIAPAGWLLLGPSDPAPEAANGFEPVRFPDAVIWRRARLRMPEATAWTARRKQPVSRGLPHSSKRASRIQSPWPPVASAPITGGRRMASAAGDGRSATLTAAEREVRESPLDAGRHLRLGMLYLELASIGPAVEALRRAAFLDSQSPLIQYTLGRAHLLNGSRSLAKATLGHAQRLIAGVPEDVELDGAEGLLAGDLRQAIEVELSSAASLSSGRAAAPTDISDGNGSPWSR